MSVTSCSLSRAMRAALCAAVVLSCLVLTPEPVSGSMPGENGELLVFGHAGGERGLYLVDLEPLWIRKLPIEAHDIDIYSAAWSPTGSAIAFARYDPNIEQHGLWVHELASGETRLLRGAEPGVQFTDVSWSPSGKEIVVGTIRNSGDGRHSSIMRVTAAGELLEEISLQDNLVSRMEWSPIRPELLLWIHREDSPSNACLLSLETSELECVVDGGRWPTWSPDGDLIALDTRSSRDLTVVDRAGDLLARFSGAFGQMATWSPDGNFIAYPVYVGEEEVGQFAIAVLDLSTSKRHGYLAGISNVLDMRWRPQRPASGFLDVLDDYVFAIDITWLAANGYTTGCNPPRYSEFCPSRAITRGEMAAFLHRALGDRLSPVKPATDFTDMVGSEFAADIAWLSATGLTKGCNPPKNDRFCPEDPMTRGQAAAFFVRALGLSDDGGGDLFIDDDDSVFEHAIDRLATAGVTRGCNPAEGNTRYCPSDTITRGQVAAFLHRALGSR